MLTAVGVGVVVLPADAATVPGIASIAGTLVQYKAAAMQAKAVNNNVVVTRSGRTVAREPLEGKGFDAIPAAHSRALAKLSADIAAAIRAASAAR